MNYHCGLIKNCSSSFFIASTSLVNILLSMFDSVDDSKHDEQYMLILSFCGNPKKVLDCRLLEMETGNSSKFQLTWLSFTHQHPTRTTKKKKVTKNIVSDVRLTKTLPQSGYWSWQRICLKLICKCQTHPIAAKSNPHPGRLPKRVTTR